MRGAFLYLIFAVSLGFGLSQPTVAEEIVAQFNQTRVSITTNFEGSQIVVYGAIKRDSPAPTNKKNHVIITLEGPSSPIVVRRKDRVMGIWANNAELGFERAPSFYAIMSTAPLAKVIDEATDRLYHITIPRAIRASTRNRDAEQTTEFTDALIRVRTSEGNYVQSEYGLRLLQDTLFQGKIDLPANITEGAYRVRIFITRDGQVIDSQFREIDVRRVGLERWFFNLAHEQPLIYGILALFLAIFFGWGASALFRYIRP